MKQMAQPKLSLSPKKITEYIQISDPLTENVKKTCHTVLIKVSFQFYPLMIKTWGYCLFSFNKHKKIVLLPCKLS